MVSLRNYSVIILAQTEESVVRIFSVFGSKHKGLSILIVLSAIFFSVNDIFLS